MYFYIFEGLLKDKIYWKSPDCVKIIFLNFFPVLCQRSFSQGSTTSSKNIFGSWSRQVTFTLCWKICSIIIIVSVRTVCQKPHGKLIEHLNISFFSFEQSLILPTSYRSIIFKAKNLREHFNTYTVDIYNRLGLALDLDLSWHRYLHAHLKHWFFKHRVNF